jgi:hypothetical protein
MGRTHTDTASVKEHLALTGEDSSMATLMLSVMGAFAEFERALIMERRREGIAAAALEDRGASGVDDQVGVVGVAGVDHGCGLGEPPLQLPAERCRVGG